MMKNSPYYCPGRGANPRPLAHPDFITSKESHTQLELINMTNKELDNGVLKASINYIDWSKQNNW